MCICLWMLAISRILHGCLGLQGKSYTWKLWKVGLENNGEDQLDWSCEKWRIRLLHRVRKERYILGTLKMRKANWIGHISRRKCLLKHTVEGKIEGKTEMMGRRWRRRQQLLDGVTERRGYWKLKEESIDFSVGRIGIGIGYGHVIQNTGWMNTRSAWLLR
jgi:hypothetical protein